MKWSCWADYILPWQPWYCRSSADPCCGDLGCKKILPVIACLGSSLSFTCVQLQEIKTHHPSLCAVISYIFSLCQIPSKAKVVISQPYKNRWRDCVPWNIILISFYMIQTMRINKHLVISQGGIIANRGERQKITCYAAKQHIACRHAAFEMLQWTLERCQRRDVVVKQFSAKCCCQPHLSAEDKFCF